MLGLHRNRHVRTGLDDSPRKINQRDEQETGDCEHEQHPARLSPGETPSLRKFGFARAHPADFVLVLFGWPACLSAISRAAVSWSPHKSLPREDAGIRLVISSGRDAT